MHVTYTHTHMQFVLNMGLWWSVRITHCKNQLSSFPWWKVQENGENLLVLRWKSMGATILGWSRNLCFVGFLWEFCFWVDIVFILLLVYLSSLDSSRLGFLGYLNNPQVPKFVWESFWALGLTLDEGKKTHTLTKIRA